MRIGRVEAGEIDGAPAATADVRTDAGQRATVWFAADVDDLVISADSFAIALFPQALALGEDLVVEDPLDPGLLDGLDAVGHWFGHWFPTLVPRRSRIVAEAATALPGPVRASAARRAGVLSSGGVDSLSTIVRTVDRSPVGHPARIGRLLTIDVFAGSDDPEHQGRSRTQRAVSDASARLGEEIGATATLVRTNVLALRGWAVDRVWGQLAHGGTYIGATHVLAGSVGSLAVAASDWDASTEPWATHPITDPMFTTSYLPVRHDGTQFSRDERLAQVVDHGRARQMLHVCTTEQDGLANCGHCEKCLRTMVALDLAGRLGDVPTFAVDHVDARLVADTWINDYSYHWYWRGYVKVLEAAGRADLAEAVRRKDPARWDRRARRLAGRTRRRLRAH